MVLCVFHFIKVRFLSVLCHDFFTTLQSHFCVFLANLVLHVHAPPPWCWGLNQDLCKLCKAPYCWTVSPSSNVRHLTHAFLLQFQVTIHQWMSSSDVCSWTYFCNVILTYGCKTKRSFKDRFKEFPSFHKFSPLGHLFSMCLALIPVNTCNYYSGQIWEVNLICCFGLELKNFHIQLSKYWHRDMGHHPHRLSVLSSLSLLGVVV